MADLESAIDYLMGTLIAGISGIKQAPKKPVESSPDFPIALAIPIRGRMIQNTVGEYRQMAVIRLALHVTRTQGINSAVDQALPFLDSIGDVLMDSDNATLNGNVTTIVYDEAEPIIWEFAPSALADVETYAWFYDMTVKYRRTP